MDNVDQSAMRAARHLALAQIGAEGQAKIASSTVLLIGLGGIGCAAASYLASSGVGHLLLSDFDTVDESNLGRQILYGPADIGELKVQSAVARLERINPDIRLTAIADRLVGDSLMDAVRDADIVLDGCDNFATRFAVNDACVAQQRRLISGSAIRFEAQLAAFGPDYDASPCYRCLYTEADESLENCAGNGVLAPVPGVVGTMMAVEALKFLGGIKNAPGRLTLYEGLSGDWRQVTIGKRSDCSVCSN
jgi:adenylyltransferase/sulfurtransferase